MRRSGEPVEEVRVPRERKGDVRPEGGAAGPPRLGDRRAASGCLWDACEALLSSTADPSALERALDALLAAFDCEGAALHARSEEGTLETWCARGDWERAPGDLREAMCVPLYRGRERVGALDLLARRGQRWRPEQRSLVRTASGALGAALGARLELDRYRRQPGRDEVTGLADARAFHQRLVEEMGRAEQAGQPVAIVTVDVDHFKAINERFGPPAGDQVLAESAMVLRLALRDGDFIARLAHHLEPGLPGQRDVGEDQVRARVGDEPERLLGAGGERQLHALVAQHLAQHVGHGVVVLDDEHARGRRRRGRAHACACGAAGLAGLATFVLGGHAVRPLSGSATVRSWPCGAARRSSPGRARARPRT